MSFALWIDGDMSTLASGCSARIVMPSTVMAELGVLISAALTCKHEAESENVAARNNEKSDARMDFIVGMIMCD